MNLLAEVSSSGDVHVSVGGLILGALIGVGLYLLGQWLAGETGQRFFYYAGIVLGLLVFFLLGFDIYG